MHFNTFFNTFFFVLNCILVLYFLCVLFKDFDMLFNNFFMLIDLLSLFAFKIASERKNKNENDEIKITIDLKYQTKKRFEEKRKNSIICLF